MPPPPVATTDAIPSSLSVAPSAFLSSRPHIERLMAAAIIFRTAPGSSNTPQMLIIRRAASDSYPGKWEGPGGSTSDRKDETVLAGAVREAFEETGLHVTKALYPVGMMSSFKNISVHPESHPAVPTGLGIEPDEEKPVNDQGDDARTVSFMETGQVWGKVTVVVDVAEDLATDESAQEGIKLCPTEHDAFAWVTEEEVKSAKWSSGKGIDFVSAGVWSTLLEAFRLHREGGA